MIEPAECISSLIDPIFYFLIFCAHFSLVLLSSMCSSSVSFSLVCEVFLKRLDRLSEILSRISFAGLFIDLTLLPFVEQMSASVPF